MKRNEGLLLFAIVFFVAAYGGCWCFNHINPWIGIAIILAVFYGGGRVVYNYINKSNKKTDEK